MPGAQCVFGNGKIYAKGSSSLFCSYDIGANQWTRLENAPYTTADIICAIGNKVYFNMSDKRTLSVFDTDNNSWTTTSTSPYAIRYAGGINGKIYNYSNNSIYMYDPQTDLWSEGMICPFIPVPTNAVSAVAGNKLYIKYWTGTMVTLYDAEKEQWEYGPPAPNSISTSHPGILVGGEDTLYLLFGLNGGIYPEFAGRNCLSHDASGGGSEPQFTPELGILLDENAQGQLSVTNDPGKNAEYAWSTVNPGIATVDGNGLVTGVGAGRTRAYATKDEDGFKLSIRP